MPEQSEYIPQYYEDVDLADDYNILVPEIAKLDKTFPTNDCSICMSAPRIQPLPALL